MGISDAYKKGAGKPPFTPSEGDRATVMIMHACGKTHAQIARCIGVTGISQTTLRKHFAHELSVGKDKLDGICMTGIAKLMQEGNPAALFFYAKTRMGWRETVKAVFTGENDGPIEFRDTESAKRALEDRIAGVAERIRTEQSIQ